MTKTETLSSISAVIAAAVLGASVAKLVHSSSASAQSAPAKTSDANRSPARFAQLLAEFDAAPATSPRRAVLERDVDNEAGQRYSTVARLFWYTDLEQAKAASKAAGKPILSLRMLGDLRDDLSCANSRFFRTVLYADPTVSAYLRTHFVLHWSSERAVPKVTFDMGDGRQIVRTTTGNSAHYILSADGTALDALPGLYAPVQFVDGLKAAEALALQVKNLNGAQRAAAIVAYHHKANDKLDAHWRKHPTLESVPVVGRLATAADASGHLARAQRATVSKARIEVPDLQTMQLGPRPGDIAKDAEQWRLVGQAMFNYGAIIRSGDPVAKPLARRSDDDPVNLKASGWNIGSNVVLSEPAKQLFLRLRHELPADAKIPTSAQDAAALAVFEGMVVADTAQNEFSLHQRVHSLFERRFTDVGETMQAFASINAAVYSEIFATPANDPWMGLVDPTAFTGLPGDGITVAQPSDLTRTAKR
jgi:hypothetical protein